MSLHSEIAISSAAPAYLNTSPEFGRERFAVGNLRIDSEPRDTPNSFERSCQAGKFAFRDAEASQHLHSSFRDTASPMIERTAQRDCYPVDTMMKPVHMQQDIEDSIRLAAELFSRGEIGAAQMQLRAVAAHGGPAAAAALRAISRSLRTAASSSSRTTSAATSVVGYLDMDERFTVAGYHNHQQLCSSNCLCLNPLSHQSI
jgi:hypothetical protein